mmetsp:Transcript_17190/g.44701  ORF Transcript_17190/g.44701 Transcript_17190/m.44701 type:complete len:146 (+) Transcript_17190:84-521(+)
MSETGVVPFGRLPPDCATIDFFDVGDCAPGVVDHHDFERPVYTVSMLSSQRICIGQTVRTPTAGDFGAEFTMLLPRRSILTREKHSADLVKLAIPGVQEQRVSVTFRRMRPRFALEQQDAQRQRNEAGAEAGAEGGGGPHASAQR